MRIKALLIQAVCALMLAMRLTATVVLADSCDDWNFSVRKPTVQDHANTINYYIRQNVTHFGRPLTAEQLEVSIATFQNVQQRLSGKLMCEIDEVKYYYPKFILVRSEGDHVVTEATKYYVSPLDVDENGVYTGVEVSAFDGTTEEDEEFDRNVREMNYKFSRIQGNFLTSEELLGRYAMIKALNQEYHNKLLGFCSVHKHTWYAPTFDTCQFRQNIGGEGYIASVNPDAPLSDVVSPENVRWKAYPGAKDEHGCYRTMIIQGYPAVNTGSTSTGELMRQAKEAGGSTEEEASGTSGPCMIPDVPVEIK